MIRLTYLLRRRPGMSRAEFQRYWKENHGPLVAGHARALNVLRYVQVHTLDEERNRQATDPRGKMEEPYDGVAELWWYTRDDVVSAGESPRGQEASQELVEDEARFIDLPNSPLWFAYEYPQVNPSPERMVATEMGPLVKLYYPFHHLASLTMEEAQLYWRTCHGPLIRLTAEAGHIKRYIQVHRFEDELEAASREARGTVVEPYTGHAELWFDRAELAARAALPQRTDVAQRVYEDEARFIDFARSTTFFAKEHVFVDYR